jgi:gluconate 2-dehydrogenase gamma chain
MIEAVSRRQFVSILAGTVGGAWLATNSSELLAAAARASRLDAENLQTFRVLTAADARDIEAATALIVPTDDTPGAREARVVHFVDQSLASFAQDQKPQLQAAVAELRKRARRKNASSFAALSEADQVRILEDMEKKATEHFNLLWSVTLVGMLANPSYGGNFGKAGWKWIGFSDQFSWAAPYGWYDRNDK